MMRVLRLPECQGDQHVQRSVALRLIPYCCVNMRGTSRSVLRCRKYDYRNASDSGVRVASAGVVRYLATRMTPSLFLLPGAHYSGHRRTRDIRRLALALVNVRACPEPRA